MAALTVGTLIAALTELDLSLPVVVLAEDRDRDEEWHELVRSVEARSFFGYYEPAMKGQPVVEIATSS